MIRKLKDRIVQRYSDAVIPWYLAWAPAPERPLLLIVGRRGSGKTALATKIAQERMRAGERVFANYYISDPVTGRRAGFIHSLYDLMDLKNCTVVVDEANVWCNSRQWQAIPPDVIARWQMSRKEKVNLIFTSQHESRVDVIIRELADWILVCERTPLIPKWVRLFRYHMTYLEDINEVRRGKVSRPHYWWGRVSILGGYDTTQLVDTEQLKVLREYQAAVKKGIDPATVGLVLPDRIEPCRIGASGEVLDWD